MKAKYSAYSATKEMNGSSSSISAAGFQKHLYLLVSIVFIGAIALGSLALHKLHPAFFFLYLAMSLVTIVVYVMDKRKAVKSQWRIPEATLHICELLCGWPGAMIAQVLIRHKNAKLSFQLVFWAMIIVNVGIFAFIVFK
jgi:uncharacterized membrane protein YsdA (DUF1294 family)